VTQHVTQLTLKDHFLDVTITGTFVCQQPAASSTLRAQRSLQSPHLRLPFSWIKTRHSKISTYSGHESVGSPLSRACVLANNASALDVYSLRCANSYDGRENTSPSGCCSSRRLEYFQRKRLAEMRITRFPVQSFQRQRRI
jgi:hypothetical protein